MRRLGIRAAILCSLLLLVAVLGRPVFWALWDRLAPEPPSSDGTGRSRVRRDADSESPDSPLSSSAPAPAPLSRTAGAASHLPPDNARMPDGRPRSKYYSIGAVKPFYGDVEDRAMLLQAAASRSFKGEIIVLASYARDFGGEWMRWVAAAVISMRNAGFEHYLLLFPDQAACDNFLRLLPSGNCGWNSNRFGHPPSKAVDARLDQWDIPHGSSFWLVRMMRGRFPPNPVPPG